VRGSRPSLRIGAVAALVLLLATLWQGPPAGAQTSGFPDAHFCELSANPPSNSGPGVISVTATARCFTDRSRMTPGQYRSIDLTIRLFREDTGVPVGLPKVVSSFAPSDRFTASLTFPDPASTDPQVCVSGRHFAEVTGSVAFKSGEPPVVRFRSTVDGSEILRTGAAFVTCESRIPVPSMEVPPPPPAPTPTPNPNPVPPPDPAPEPIAGPPCYRFPCAPPIVGEPPA
jgi:hypothetical protein